MKPPSVTTLAQFRELTGDEMLVVLTQTLAKVLSSELRRSGHFESSTCYPVVRISGEFRLKVLPRETLPESYIIPFDVILPDKEALNLSEGEELIIDTGGKIDREIGTEPSNAPDRIREEYDLPVLQPQVDQQGNIRNMPVERKS